MRIFITGASGFVGRALIPELLDNGHQVVGLARSDASAAIVRELGGTVLRGDLDDLDSIREGAAAADAVVHLANKHDFANPAVSNSAERAAVEAIGETLAGSDRPFALASGMAGAGLGRELTEQDASPFVGPDSMRGGSENRALDFVDQGVRTIVARFAPTVHGEGDKGFIRVIADTARRRGSAPYPGDGQTRWPAVHRSDTARMIRLGLEKAPAGSILHAVGEDGIPMRDIATAIAAQLGIGTDSVTPDDLKADIGFIGMVMSLDMPATSKLTRDLLGWQPTGPTLLEDVNAGFYTR